MALWVGCCVLTIVVLDLRHRRRIYKFLYNAQDLVQINMAANILILPGITRKGKLEKLKL